MGPSPTEGSPRYPRTGHPLAPRTLKEVLAVPAPWLTGPGNELADLDETAWSRFDGTMCERLALAVIEQVRLAVSRGLPQFILDRPLPPVSERLTFSDLELETRTFNCLIHAGAKRPAQLASHTISNVLSLPGFGAKCLVDLLTALESARQYISSEEKHQYESASPAGDSDSNTSPRELNEELTSKALQARELPYARAIRVDDPRLGRQVRSVITAIGTRSLSRQARATTLRDMAQYLVDRRVDPPDPHQAIACLGGILHDVEGLSRGTLEDELRSIVVAAGGERRGVIMLRYCGLDGQGGCTLQVAGDEYGITRARVQQIHALLVSALRRTRAFMPILDAVLAMIADYAPCSAEELESRLVSSGLTKQKFSLDGLAHGLATLSIKSSFSVAATGGQRFVLPRGHENLPNTISHIARATVGRSGVTTIEDIVGQVHESGQNIGRPFIESILRAQRDFQWLDEAGGWFWLQDVRRNRLLNQISKIVSVAPRIAISELRDGVSRPHRMRGFAPPRRVLLELCRQLPGYKIEDDKVLADPPPSPTDVLADSEKVMLRILKNYGPIMQRQKFEEFCLSSGINFNAFYQQLGYSPIIRKYAPSVYGLVGADVGPGEVESLVDDRVPRKRVEDYGWTSQREIWMVLRVSESMVRTGIVSIPAAITRFVAGQFRLTAEDGAFFGMLTVKNTAAWSLRPFFIRRGCEPGDQLTLVFNLSKRKASVSVGDAVDSL